MTDVLLAHAFFLKNDPKQVEKMRPYPPLGTLYAASHLREKGFSVALFDAMLEEGEAAYEALLAEHQPRFVAFYEDTFHFLNKMCLSHVREAACRMSAAARKAGATVIAAGSDITDHPQEYFDNGVQYALVGEPDHTLLELVTALSEGAGDARIESIAGIALPDPGAPDGVRLTPGREPERHPDTLPFPAWDLIDAERYRKAWTEAHGYFSVNMVTTRGCPFHCNWCAKPLWGRRYAMRSAENVAEEMALLKRTVNPDHIWFADDIFGLQPKWVIAFADAVEARDARIPFMIQSRVDLMTEKAVDALARAGCEEVWLGCESGSQKILDAMDKGTDAAEIPVARKRLQDAGIRACFFLQFGYPGETFEDILATVQMVRDTLPDDIGVSVSYPLPGTKFYDMVKAQLGSKDHWEDSQDLAMMFQGTYDTPFYRKLHRLVHRDLELRQRLATADLTNGHRPEILQELDRLNTHWLELGRLEVKHRSAAPTQIQKDYGPLAAPDLSKGWN
jgi:anaerobic magnesium-protoporphyrin IX monomethyl ester cyclase